MVGSLLSNQSLKLSIADTIVLTHALPSTSQTSYDVLPQISQELLEKPLDKSDNLRMLMDMNGAICEVVTGVCVGQSPSSCLSTSESDMDFHPVYPVIYSPGYTLKWVPASWLRVSALTASRRSIDERTLVYFADNPEHLIQAYVDSGEGIDRAGGFAIQVVLLLWQFEKLTDCDRVWEVFWSARLKETIKMSLDSLPLHSSSFLKCS